MSNASRQERYLGIDAGNFGEVKARSDVIESLGMTVKRESTFRLSGSYTQYRTEHQK
jgi:hypothetical protein